MQVPGRRDTPTHRGPSPAAALTRTPARRGAGAAPVPTGRGGGCEAPRGAGRTEGTPWRPPTSAAVSPPRTHPARASRGKRPRPRSAPGARGKVRGHVAPSPARRWGPASPSSQRRKHPKSTPPSPPRVGTRSPRGSGPSLPVARVPPTTRPETADGDPEARRGGRTHLFGTLAGSHTSVGGAQSSAGGSAPARGAERGGAGDARRRTRAC